MPSLQTLSLPYYADSEPYFKRLGHLPGCVWLDSGKRRAYNSRYDILSALPREHILSQNTGCQVQPRDGNSQYMDCNALDYIQHYLAALQPITDASDLPFTGGAIGYLGYEALHPTFGLAAKVDDNAENMPDINFGIYDWALIQDHHKQKAFLCFLDICPGDLVSEIQQLLTASSPEPGTFSCDHLQPDITREAYLSAVERIQNHIRAGDCYQVNFAQRFSGSFQGSTAAAYLPLRRALPGPFSAYLDTPTGTILSLSPERFIKLHGRQIKTQPIKGTAPRGHAIKEDAALARQLQRSEKNRAENLMIVDLLRNDLSKVSTPFSVQVPELFGLQSFANVHHLVSTVTGTLREGLDYFDLLTATFPGGSITGAPKKRAMEIIDELEKYRRGVYCGSVMYLSLNGRMDSNIAIRTLVRTEDKMHCWGGGGIVADSDPAMEYQESLHKIELLLKTLNP